MWREQATATAYTFTDLLCMLAAALMPRSARTTHHAACCVKRHHQRTPIPEAQQVRTTAILALLYD